MLSKLTGEGMWRDSLLDTNLISISGCSILEEAPNVLMQANERGSRHCYVVLPSQDLLYRQVRCQERQCAPMGLVARPRFSVSNLAQYLEQPALGCIPEISRTMMLVTPTVSRCPSEQGNSTGFHPPRYSIPYGMIKLCGNTLLAVNFRPFLATSSSC